MESYHVSNCHEAIKPGQLTCFLEISTVDSVIYILTGW